MRSQGWTPGQYLGAKDAAQSEYFGTANATHIRAILKDDNMGLGAKRNQGDECTGLDALQELLGRLNGKSQDSLDEDKKKREDTRINKYLHRKLGTVRFVYGGLLVGDKVQELADELKKEREEKKAQATELADTSEASEGKKEKKSKKRKAEDDNIISEKKKDKKSKKQKAEDFEDESKAKRKEKKDKKKKEASKNDEESKTGDAAEDVIARKKAKKEKKEKRKKSKDDEDTSDSTTLPTTSSTPSATGISTPGEAVSYRHLARKRFIAQKRAAVMDQAALNQVWLLNYMILAL